MRNIPINIEDGELLQLPTGEVMKANGASHSQGGIDTAVPSGTKVYSDKIKVGEHTMAERKQSRTKRLMSLLEESSTSSDSTLVQNRIKRVMTHLQKLEQHDMAIQNMAHDAASQQFATGGFVLKGKTGWKSPYYGYDKGNWSRVDASGTWSPIDATKESSTITTLNDFYFKGGNISDYSADFMNGFTPGVTNSSTGLGEMPDGTIDTGKTPDHLPAYFNTPTTPVIGEEGLRNDMAVGPEEFDSSMLSGLGKGAGIGVGNLTTGDIIGLGSQIIGDVSQMANTIANAKATKKSINHYIGFNERSLQANQEAIDETGYMKDAAGRSMERTISNQINTARTRTRGASRSINTLKNLDLATDIVANNALVSGKDSLESTYGQQKLSLLGNKTQLLSEKDKMEMTGEAQAAMENEMKIDNFYTNFGQNIANFSESLQQVGKQANQSEYNRKFLKILPEMNRWGIGVDDEWNLFMKK